MKLTESLVKTMFPLCPASKRKLYTPQLNDSCLAYDIANELRVAAFFGTLGPESGELKYMEELASGDAYDTRTDLGNTPQRDGDGRLYKGRGPIQITGKANYREYTEFLKEKGHLPFVDFVKHPERLKELPYSIDSACWFFAVHIKANPLADRREFLEIQLRVNGGRKRKPPRPNHWPERQAYYARALAALPDDFRITQRYDTELVVVANTDNNTATGDEHADFDTEVVAVGLPDSNAASGLQTAGATTPATDAPTSGAAPGATGVDSALSPQIVVKERPSTFTKVMTAVTGFFATIFTSIGTYFGGNEVATRLAEKASNRVVENAERSDLATFGLVMLYAVGVGGLGLFLFWLASRIYDKSANRSNVLNQAKINAAANKGLNTVELVSKAAPPAAQTVV